MMANQLQPITVFVSVEPVRNIQRVIPGWKNPTINAAIDHEMLAASGVRDYTVKLNDEPATIYTKVAEGDHIELVPTGG
ncbi:MAG: hypothetical protein WCG99_04410 [Candidatus Berkelbacteria bacterium]